MKNEPRSEIIDLFRLSSVSSVMANTDLVLVGNVERNVAHCSHFACDLLLKCCGTCLIIMRCQHLGLYSARSDGAFVHCLTTASWPLRCMLGHV